MASAQWWTPGRIEKTVTQDFITHVLDPKYHRGLRARVFDNDLSDDTYQDLILAKARACFLILRDVGSPELIFEFIDRNFTDDDLPIAGHDEAAWHTIASIRPRLDEKFDSRQFYYCVQELQPDVHVNYGTDDIVPVATVAKGIHRGTATVKRVAVGNKELLRRKYPLEIDESSEEQSIDTESFEHYFSELNVLQHTNITRVWTTYTQDDYGYVLYGPTSQDTLKDALIDSTKYFKANTKQEQRQLLLRWTFCMACALDYLHQHGLSHQAIRPANIHLDSTMNITLGECAAYDDFNGRPDGFERLQYLHGSPEQWQRKRQILQATGQNMAPSGGRSARPDPANQPASRLSAAFFKRTASKPTSNREGKQARPMTPLSTLGHPASRPVSAGVGSIAPSLKSSSDSSIDSNTGGHASSNARPSQRAERAAHTRTESAASGIYENPTRPRKTLVATLNFSHLQTSSHDQSPLFPSDVFAAATILVEILTVLLSTSSSSFSLAKLVAHLGKRNRQAGRGGGGGAPADSSFHANLDQANSWLDSLSKGVAEVLHKAAKKKSKNKSGKDDDAEDDTQWLLATKELIELARRGLEADPRRRITASDFHADMVRINDRYTLNAGQCCSSQAPAIAKSGSTRQRIVREHNSIRENSMRGSERSSRSDFSANRTSSVPMSVIEGFSPTRSAYTESTSASEFSYSPPVRPNQNSKHLPLVAELPGETEYLSPATTAAAVAVAAASPPLSPPEMHDMANVHVSNPDRYENPDYERERYELASPEPPVSPMERESGSDGEIEASDSLYEYFSDDGEDKASMRREQADVPSLREIPLPAAWKGKRFGSMRTDRAHHHHQQPSGAIGQAM